MDIKKSKTARQIGADVTVSDEDCVLREVTMERWLKLDSSPPKCMYQFTISKINTLYHVKKSEMPIKGFCSTSFLNI